MILKSDKLKRIGTPYQFKEGGGPGGWIILVGPEIGLGEDILVPDLAGWRKERYPEEEPQNWISIPLERTFYISRQFLVAGEAQSDGCRRTRKERCLDSLAGRLNRPQLLWAVEMGLNSRSQSVRENRLPR